MSRRPISSSSRRHQCSHSTFDHPETADYGEAKEYLDVKERTVQSAQVLDDLPALHHQGDVGRLNQEPGIRQGIAVDCHQVGDLPGSRVRI